MIIIRISGNIDSLRESILNEIDALFDMEYGKSDFLPVELAEKLAELTGKINREIAVYINRKGSIIDVSIGDSGTVSLSQVDGRRSGFRLSGIRCVHTHPNGDGRLSSVDINSMLSLRLDAMIAVGALDGKWTEVYVGLPLRGEEGELGEPQLYGPFQVGDRRMNSFFDIIADLDRTAANVLHSNLDEAERAILVGLETGRSKPVNGKSEGETSLEELEELARTAGAEVVYKVLQRKQVQDPGYFIGKGKVEELSLLRQALNVNLVIFDDELSGAQVRNIEDIVGVKVIDRTTLILDIFAQRARSREGKLQVELAQLNYRLPRLIGLGTQLSRLGGGIGTRGPGEKKLEVDRRHIRRRIHLLEHELKDTGKRRRLLRENRKNNAVPTIALVGYTNVGKSTLMNKLCSSDILAENKLFATLDPTARRMVLPDGREALLIDTVGFIRKLPHDLVEAFKSTLEETVFADALIHVVDASSGERDAQIGVVNEILHSLNALNKPAILALNKVDRLPEEVRLPVTNPNGKIFEISAITGTGLEELVKGIGEMVASEETEVEVLAPYSEGWILPYIHEHGRVLEQDYTDRGVRIRAIVKNSKIQRVGQFVV